MADGQLQGRSILVTGGSRGIGRGLALGLAREGASVAVNYVERRDAADEVVAAIEAGGGRALAVKADVSKRDEVDAMVAEVVDAWGRIDTLVSNAGVIVFKEFLDTKEEDWDWILQTNLKGAFLVGQAVARTMIAHGGGQIVFVNSESGLKANRELSAYGSSKAGQLMLMRSMALSLAPHSIRVNSVHPACVPTDQNADRLADPELKQSIMDAYPLGRLGTPEDVLHAILYLISPKASWVTGSALTLDGGYTAT